MKFKSYVPVVATILVVSAVLPFVFVRADGGVTSTYNNLVPLDGGHSVMNRSGGLANNGTYAHVQVKNLSQTQGTLLILVNPNNQTTLNATVQQGGIVFFSDANLAVNGTWKVKEFLTGNVVTKFNVTIWDGVSQPGWDSSRVWLFSNSSTFIADFAGVFGVDLLDNHKTEGKLEMIHTGHVLTAIAYNENIVTGGGGVNSQGWFIETNGTDQLGTGDTTVRIIYVNPESCVVPINCEPYNWPWIGCASLLAVSPPSGTVFSCYTILAAERHYAGFISIAGCFYEFPLPDCPESRSDDLSFDAVLS